MERLTRPRPHPRPKKKTVLLCSIFLCIFMFFLLYPLPASSDIYHWTDEKGVLHLTDDIRNVPEEFREKAGVIKTKPAEEGEEGAEEGTVAEPAPPVPPATEAGEGEGGEEGEELYGGRTLNWWKLQFHILRKEIETVEADYYEKKRFVEVYRKLKKAEEGLAESSLYLERKDTEEPYLYERYRKEIVWDEQRLEELRSELEELRGSARSAGVPKDVRQ